MELKTTVAIASGIILVWGSITYERNIRPMNQCMLKNLNLDEIVSGTHILNAAKYLNKNNYMGLTYLKFALGQDVPIKYDSEDITRTAKQVIDKYSKDSKYYYMLLDFAKEADKYERKETAKNILKEELKNLSKKDCSDSFRYHIWMIYELDLKKTNSIEETHKNLRDFYRKDNMHNYVIATEVLDSVEQNLQKNVPSFVERVMQNSSLESFFSKLL
ncbi:MAG: hypothetical protein U9R34_03720 [Nanoarchaeota archaeon]|nr:hypothetical protein [Nanoarchaeota archaeon]